MTPKARKNHRVFCEIRSPVAVKEFGAGLGSTITLVSGLAGACWGAEDGFGGSVRGEVDGGAADATDFAGGGGVGAALCATDGNAGVTSLAVGVTFGKGTAISSEKSEIRSSKPANP